MVKQLKYIIKYSITCNWSIVQILMQKLRTCLIHKQIFIQDLLGFCRRHVIYFWLPHISTSIKWFPTLRYFVTTNQNFLWKSQFPLTIRLNMWKYNVLNSFMWKELFTLFDKEWPHRPMGLNGISHNPLLLIVHSLTTVHLF